MTSDHDMRPLLKQLFEAQSLGVLATDQSRQPYASLVAYAVSDDFRCIFFATPRATRKYANIRDNPRVAFLINSALNRPADFHQAVSVTAIGRAAELSEAEMQPFLPPYLTKHPYLQDFVRAPSCAGIRIGVDRYIMVSNFQNVSVWHLTPTT